MGRLEEQALQLLRTHAQPCVLVTVSRTRGSAPREAGAWMLVCGGSSAAEHPTIGMLLGTVGGGHLEWQALQQAQVLLAGDASTAPAPSAPLEQRYALGPSLGQCCGGEVWLHYECVDAHHAPLLAERWQRCRDGLPVVALFGGGHVGTALVRALLPLPLRVRWVDSREGVFPPDLAALVETEYSDPVQAAVADLPAHSRVVIMSFSHAEDLDIVAACLQRQRQRGDLPYVGLIGSRSKWAAFCHKLEARGFTAAELAHVTSPIGIPGIPGKEPAVIALAVAAQILQQSAT